MPDILCTIKSSSFTITKHTKQTKKETLKDIYDREYSHFPEASFYRTVKSLEYRHGVKINRGKKRSITKTTYFELQKKRSKGASLKDIIKEFSLNYSESSLANMLNGRMFKDWYCEYNNLNPEKIKNPCYKCGKDRGENRMFCHSCRLENERVSEETVYNICGSIGRTAII